MAIKNNRHNKLDEASVDYEDFIIVDGRIRTYQYNIPQSYTGEKPVPLLLVLHGWPSNSRHMRRDSELDEKSEREGFIVVYPNGHIVLAWLFESLKTKDWELGWNFWNQDPNPADDVNYIDCLIYHFVQLYNINESRIYITGLSGGASMSYRLGAELTSKIAAIAPVAGPIGGIWDVPEPDDSLEPYMIPKPSSSLPVIIFQGTNDEFALYDGGWREADNPPGFRPFGPKTWLYVMPVNESVSFWVSHNNCDSNPVVEYSYNDTVVKETYTGGDDGSEVVLYTVVDGEHVWFGSTYSEYPCKSFINDEMWYFFENHPKQ